ncbi:MAG: hypothetical protein ACRYG5_15160 [Janthinobacterium lividum]
MRSCGALSRRSSRHLGTSSLQCAPQPAFFGSNVERLNHVNDASGELLLKTVRQLNVHGASIVARVIEVDLGLGRPAAARQSYRYRTIHLEGSAQTAPQPVVVEDVPLRRVMATPRDLLKHAGIGDLFVLSSSYPATPAGEKELLWNIYSLTLPAWRRGSRFLMTLPYSESLRQALEPMGFETEVKTAPQAASDSQRRPSGLIAVNYQVLGDCRLLGCR